MPTYRVSYLFPTCFRRLLEDIEADGLDVEQDGAWWVLWKSQLVMGQPRRVVRLRVSAREATIEQLPCSAEQENDQRHPAGPADGQPDHQDGPF